MLSLYSSFLFETFSVFRCLWIYKTMVHLHLEQQMKSWMHTQEEEALLKGCTASRGRDMACPIGKRIQWIIHFQTSLSATEDLTGHKLHLIWTILKTKFQHNQKLLCYPRSIIPMASQRPSDPHTNCPVESSRWPKQSVQKNSCYRRSSWNLKTKLDKVSRWTVLTGLEVMRKRGGKWLLWATQAGWGKINIEEGCMRIKMCLQRVCRNLLLQCPQKTIDGQEEISLGIQLFHQFLVLHITVDHSRGRSCSRRARKAASSFCLAKSATESLHMKD